MESSIAVAETSSDRAQRQLDSLRDQLKRAVEAENFELAAELRDRIRTMEQAWT